MLRLQALAIDRQVTPSEACRMLIMGLDDAGDGAMGRAVTEALAALPDEPRDAAARQLAREYARQLDDTEAYLELGPRLLAALTALGLTPAARGAAPVETPAKPASAMGGLRDEVGAARARRAAGS